jgi:hypothetical protein
MKITTFDPYILTKDAETLIQLFGKMGFQERHKQEDIAGQELTGIVMKDANGFKVNIVQSADLPKESLTGIRMNVDDFDEAYELLTSRGFQKAPGTDIVDTGSAKALLMIAPSGFLLELIQHIKKNPEESR